MSGCGQLIGQGIDSAYLLDYRNKCGFGGLCSACAHELESEIEALRSQCDTCTDKIPLRHEGSDGLTPEERETVRRLRGANERLRAALDRLIHATDADLSNACLSYRHDYGLLGDEERTSLRFKATEWARAWWLTLRGEG